MARTVRLTAHRGVITLDELEDFVRDARDAGVPGNEQITAEVDGRGNVLEIEAEIGR